MSVICVPYHLDEYLPDLPSLLPDDGDVTTVIAELPDSDIWTRLSRLFEDVAGRVKESHRTTPVAKVVSGDCMTSLGTMAGLQRAGCNPGIVWFDAHGDVQTLETSASGYLGGLPLRLLVGYRPDLLAARLGLRAVDEDRVVLVGARDLDPPEVEYLEQSDIRRCGVEDVSAEILPAGPLLVHVDLDVVDAGELPGLCFPVPGGPSATAVVDAVNRVCDTGRVLGISLACTWQSDADDPTGVRSRILAEMLGAARHWD